MAEQASSPAPVAADMVATGVDALSTWRERLADPHADLAPVVEHVLTAALAGRIPVDPVWLRRKVELTARIADAARSNLDQLTRHLDTIQPARENGDCPRCTEPLTHHTTPGQCPPPL